MKRKPVTPVEWIFVIAVPLVSLLNILSVLFGTRPWISIAVSLLGIAAALLFLQNKRAYVPLMMTWALVQLVIVTSYSGVRQLGDFFPTGVNWNWDPGQFFEFQWTLTWGGNNGALTTGINLLAIAFIALAIWLRKDSIAGLLIKLKPLKSDSFLADLLPAEAAVVRRVSLSDETNWYLVQLKDKTPETYLFLRPKDDFFLKPKESQVVACLKIPDPQWVLSAPNLDRKQFSTGSWAVTNPK